MSWPQEQRSEPERPSERDAEGEAKITEPGTPPIDDDLAGSVNAALPEADD
jgi:hypothetical protein